jgi:hypothetical protein
VVAVSAAVLRLPLVAKAPVHPPDAVHEVALAELHVKSDVPPEVTSEGDAVKETVGAGSTLTAAVSVALAPPAPVHDSEYEVLVVRAPVLRVPLTGKGPDQPPDAVQALALAELHVSTAAAPADTEVGAALSVAVAAGAAAMTATVAFTGALLPPGPVQVSEKMASLTKTPVDCVPLVGNAALQAPDAVHALAFCESHVRVDVAPAVMALGFAVSVAVGTAATPITVDALLLPPAPVHVRVNVVPAVSAPVLCVPLNGNAPLQPPDAVQLCALVALHVSVAAAPLATVWISAVKETVGGALTDTVTDEAALLPAGPVQVRA